MKQDTSNYNKLCARCKNKCKQKDTSLLVTCPKFKGKPVQLTFKFTGIEIPKK